MNIEERLRKRIHILDGAMGTMILHQGLKEEDFRGERYRSHKKNLAGFCDVLNLTYPEIIYNIHRRYLEAGADLIETNTFNSNRLSLAEYGLDDDIYAINIAGAETALRAVADYCASNGKSADERPLVVGNIGPTGISLSHSKGKFSEVIAAIEEQGCALLRGGVDILMLETVYDLENLKASVDGILTLFSKEGISIPVMVSATIERNGKLPSGHSLEEFIESSSPLSPLSIGLNCGFGTEAMAVWLKRLSELSDAFISVHPNAGLPDESGNYHDTPSIMGDLMRNILKSGYVNIAGGCCGTTPSHIRVISETAKKCGKVREFRLNL